MHLRLLPVHPQLQVLKGLRHRFHLRPRFRLFNRNGTSVSSNCLHVFFTHQLRLLSVHPHDPVLVAHRQQVAHTFVRYRELLFASEILASQDFYLDHCQCIHIRSTWEGDRNYLEELDAVEWPPLCVYKRGKRRLVTTCKITHNIYT